MKLNFKNRVRNFKFSVGDIFVPLFEAIMNSMQSIEETNNIQDKYIKINIERDNYRIGGFVSGIFAIEIIDNGIGFTEHNYDSFCTSDSDYKVEIGGKGVGRINWLKAFEYVKVNSTYLENGKTLNRTFDFNIEDEIHNEVLKEVTPSEELNTRIKLIDLKQEYREATELSLKDIASKIIEHFATYFVIGAMPQITISDEEEVIDLNEFFEQEKFITTKHETLLSNNTTFNLRHVFLNASINAKHKIYICAQNRVVCSYDITNIKDLPTTFNIDGKKAIYQCYLSGEFLDKDVNSERTYFSNVIFEERTNDDVPHFELAINLYEVVYNQITIFLHDYVNQIREVRDEEIAKYIENNLSQYKYLTKYASNELKNIPYAIATNPDKLANELSKLSQKINIKNNIQVNKTLQDPSMNAKNKLLDLLIPLSENLRSEFANYILKRKAVIDILEKILSLNPTTKELINDFFILDGTPTTDNTNLWMIDNRLSLNYLLQKSATSKFIACINEQEKELIAIYFTTTYKTNYTENNHPINIINYEIDNLNLDKDYTVTKYLLVGQNNGQFNDSKGDVKVLSYEELINKEKNKINLF